ncbi:hypothetical protein C0992_008404 [Termitomyces sp. T32_za158]|nr:hypothetical protein C0992_008404 [Termitomyces sp. T32_za158]
MQVGADGGAGGKAGGSGGGGAVWSIGRDKKGGSSAADSGRWWNSEEDTRGGTQRSKACGAVAAGYGTGAGENAVEGVLGGG